MIKSKQKIKKLVLGAILAYIIYIPSIMAYNSNFYYWNCTWYISGLVKVDWSGNAKEWLTNAKNQWKKISKIPKERSIWVMTGGEYWHVFFVEKILKNWKLQISEMNWVGLWIISIRIIEPTYADWYIYID